MKIQKLTISQLAKACDVNVETIRYYQSINLIHTPTKPLTGYRIYPDETIGTVKFIKRAQQLGFSLAEIAELLELGSGQCHDVRHQAEQKRQQINRQIEDLISLRDTLDNLILSCESINNAPCPIVDSLRNID
jgi:MerR family mercuric resistance operon transcriptional regulator